MLRRMPPHKSGSQLAPSCTLYALLVVRPLALLLWLLRDAPPPRSTIGHRAARAACVPAAAWRTRASYSAMLKLLTSTCAIRSFSVGSLYASHQLPRDVWSAG